MRAVSHDRADTLLAHRGKTSDHRARGLLAVEARELEGPGVGVAQSFPVLGDHHAAENGPADSGYGSAGVEAHALNKESIERKVRESQQLKEDDPAERRPETQRQATYLVGRQPLVDRRRLGRRRYVRGPGLVPVGGQVRNEETQSGTHVVAQRGLHARGRGQHRVNDEGGGGVFPAGPVDVHLHIGTP